MDFTIEEYNEEINLTIIEDGDTLEFSIEEVVEEVNITIEEYNGADGIGLKGDKPDHEWNGTQLRFENPDDTWGEYVDLKGDGGTTVTKTSDLTNDGADGTNPFITALDVDLSPYALDADLDTEEYNRALEDFILDSKITTEKNRNDTQDGLITANTNAVAELSLNQIEITTSASITTNTVGTVTGKAQHMRSVLVKNGVNAINITLETSSHTKFEAIYYKKGSAAITFVAGAGATLVKVANDGILNGAVDSNALVYRDGNTFYLYISNY